MLWASLRRPAMIAKLASVAFAAAALFGVLNVVVVMGDPAIPITGGQYSSGLVTTSYNDLSQCDFDSHWEYISTPLYANSVAQDGTAELDVYSSLTLGRRYTYNNATRSQCTSRTLTPDEIYPLRGAYVGDWLPLASSGTVYAGNTTVNGASVYIWQSDPTSLIDDYKLYVTPDGIPIRESACVMDENDGYYAYVTDFPGYTVGTPSAYYISVPSSCPTPQGASFAESSLTSDSVADAFPAPRWAAQTVQCTDFTYSSLCLELNVRIAAAAAAQQGTNTGSSSGGLIALWVILGIFGCVCCMYVLVKFADSDGICHACCGPSYSPPAYPYQPAAPTPSVTFHSDASHPEVVRPPGDQLIREVKPVRPEWKAELAAAGFTYAIHDDGKPYWDESAAYRLTKFAATELENATRELHARCMDAVSRVISSDDLLAKFGIPSLMWPLIRNTYNNQAPSIYGRFDLMYDGKSPPKMLEYNADTPTCIIESGIAQRTWLLAAKKNGWVGAECGQFNELERELRQAFRELKENKTATAGNPTWYFACVKGSKEDAENMAAMAGFARDAGLLVETLFIEDIKFDPVARTYTAPSGFPVDHCWKLYPLEWMAAEQLGHLAESQTQWMEPAWKLILSSKAVLPLLWQMFPNHPNLLPAYFTEAEAKSAGDRYVRKPIQGREGQNTGVFESNGSPVFEKPGHMAGPYVYQKWMAPPEFDGVAPMAGPPLKKQPSMASMPPPPPFIPPPEYAPPPYDFKGPEASPSPSPSVAALSPTPVAADTAPLLAGAGAFTVAVAAPPPYAAVPAVPVAGATTITVTATPMTPAAPLPPPPGPPDAPPPPAGPPVKMRPVFGSWIVNGEPAGIVIREDPDLITTNVSRIVPHYVETSFTPTPPSSEPPSDQLAPADAVSYDEPGVSSSGVVLYGGYRYGTAWRRSTYYYRMSPIQQHFYRRPPPPPPPVVYHSSMPVSHSSGWGGGGGFHSSGHSSFGS